ncbi:TetR/AcrR family transcriptional regulator [Sulfurimonas sp.]|jgi:AcrR family transcriptional regulator|uniref:TetR/AcrR family transcriptional regulator n=1 Tax=Sulfurimonas sp. TaxID=2022749 RepID=UPI0025E9EC1B|nr:TetR/AcrR family transcriptional regulator [Sulfurimonas sp.]MCK9473756.1 TetR/AcrR family transcriptional regulator [Sulfurimonas sp.]MDD3505089.1 TetR/AcrR family transcriptional regulator [Sulfurimonas sp.]
MAKKSKKELILITAIENFSKFGYENTNLDVIAKECNITKPAIYYHFKDKAALYEAVVYSEFLKLVQTIEKNTLKGDAKERLHNYIETFGSFLISNPTFSSIFAREIASGAATLPDKCTTIISRTLSRLILILEQGAEEKVFEKENPFIIQMMIVSTLTSYNTTKPLRERIFSVLEDKSKLPEVEFENIVESLSKKIIKGLLC